MEREEGLYWVKFGENPIKEVAFWDAEKLAWWQLSPNDLCTDSQWEWIGPRIKEPEDE